MIVLGRVALVSEPAPVIKGGPFANDTFSKGMPWVTASD